MRLNYSLIRKRLFVPCLFENIPINQFRFLGNTNLAYFQERMARIKYYYDTERCRYERITPNIWTILLNLFGFLLLSFVFAVGLVFVYDHYFETPSEIILNSENEGYRLEIEITEKLVRDLEKDIRRLQKRDKEVYRIITGVDTIPFADEGVDYASTDQYDSALKGKKGALKELIDLKLQQLSELKNKINQQNASYSFL